MFGLELFCTESNISREDQRKGRDDLHSSFDSRMEKPPNAQTMESINGASKNADLPSNELNAATVLPSRN